MLFKSKSKTARRAGDRKPRAVAFGVILVVLHPLRLHSAGFSLYETSAKGNAMGGANVGRTGDASAVYANPANMTELPGVQSMTGVTLIRPSGQVETPTGTTNVRSDWFPPPHAYATWQAADRWWLGMGLYSEYGLGTRYPDDWAGRYNAIKTTMETFTLNPNVAYRVTDDLSVAIGFRAMYLDFYNKKAVPLVGGYTELDGDAWGFGYNAAVSYAVTDDLDIGLVYRSRVTEPVEGTIDYSGSLVPAYDKSTGAEADLTLPSSVTAGLNYQATDRLNLGTAVTWTEWSTYDALNIDFDEPVLGKTGSDTEKNWSDVWRFGVGADYALTKRWSLQCGYVYDMCPIDSNHADFMMPAGDRHIGSLGVGYAWSTWAVNLSYSYLMMVDNAKVVDIAGTATPVRFEDGCAHMVGLSVLKKF